MLMGSMEERHLERNGARELANAAMVSRSAWYRRMAAQGLERPASAHRRLQLERAAHRLTHTETSVSELGLLAGYENTSGFTRAFRRAYGLSPRAFRRLAPTEWRLPPFGGLHYRPAETPLSPRQGKNSMTLIELWLADHARAAERFLRALDAHPSARDEIAATRDPFPWMPSTMTVGLLADRVVRFGEPWIRYLDGGPETVNDGTLEGRLAQVEENRSRLQSLIRRFEAEGSWDMTFVDAECDPPQVFSYGAVMLHVMAYGDHARVELDLELRRRGLLEGWVPPE